MAMVLAKAKSKKGFFNDFWVDMVQIFQKNDMLGTLGATLEFT
jgi:hypothetical protein